MSLSRSIARPMLAFLMLGALALILPQRASAQLSGTLSGPRFVETAAIAGLFEIESSNLALVRSNDPQVRAFAEMMVTDHAKIAIALKRAAADANGEITLPTSVDAEHADLLKKLGAATGRDFDALYVQMQTTAHQQAVGLFGAFAKDGDQTALKAFAADTLPTLQKHLEDVLRIQLKT